jgi:hypothetical protein
VNQFTDWTPEEISKLLGYKPDENREMKYADFEDSNGPIDWR